MQKTGQTFRLLLRRSNELILGVFFSILATVAFTELIYYLTSRTISTPEAVSLTVPFENITGFIALLFGITQIITNFKITLANGVSRKNLMMASILSAAAAAAALSIINLIVALVVNFVAALSPQLLPVNFVSSLFFFSLSWLMLLLLQFVLYFLSIASGWFITLAYYRSTAPLKWAISFLPFLLYALLRTANAYTNGGLFNAINDYIVLSTKTPYTTFISFLAYTIVACGLVYLLIRRAPLKT